MKTPLAVACLLLAAPLLALARAESPVTAAPTPGLLPNVHDGAAVVALVPTARAESTAEGGPSPSPPPRPVAAPPTEAPAVRADRDLVRSWRAPLAGGLLTFPPSFASADGRYDLVLHLNGNTDLVEESYGAAGVNAVVVILNLGVGSGLYEDRFADPAGLPLILARAQAVMEKRGLRDARLGRVAVSGWSSGYGGVLSLLAQPEAFDRISAVVLLDAIHCGYDDTWPPKLKPHQIDPIRRFAQRALEGRALLSITHSEIVTYGYLDAHHTTDAILDFVGVPRLPSASAQPMPALASMEGVLPRALMVPLSPLTEAHRGELHVRGYDGNGPVTHMLHLVQMATTALPDLVRYWQR